MSHYVVYDHTCTVVLVLSVEIYLCSLLLPKQTLKNLVNKSVMRITDMYRSIERNLKSTTEKDLYQKKMASNQDEREETQS